MDGSTYLGAAHPSMSSDASSDTIEMTHLDDIDITPNSKLETAYKTAPYLDDDTQDLDDDYEGSDEGQQALLGSRRVGEPPAQIKSSLWGRVKRIVIEVRLYVSTLSDGL